MYAKVETDISNGSQTTVHIAGREMLVPAPEMLLAMKLNSLGNRTKDHKRIKDMCDITALCLFAGQEREAMIARGLAGADPGKVKTIRPAIMDEDYAQVSGLLGIPEDTVRALFERLLSRASLKY